MAASKNAPCSFPFIFDMAQNLSLFERGKGLVQVRNITNPRIYREQRADAKTFWAFSWRYLSISMELHCGTARRLFRAARRAERQ